MNYLGDLIRGKRQQKGISQETLGKLVDYDRSNLVNIEAGRLTLPDDLLERIAEVIDEPAARLKALKILDKLDPETTEWLYREIQARKQENQPSPPEA